MEDHRYASRHHIRTGGAGNFGDFLILVIKAVRQSRFTSTDINSLCGVEIIKLAFIKVVALTIRDKFLFFAFLLYLLYGKEWLFVLIINGNIKPCEMEIIQSVFSTVGIIPLGICSNIVSEDTDWIISISQGLILPLMIRTKSHSLP